MNIEYWILNTEYWILNTEYWTLNTEYWILNIDCWILNTEHWTLNTEYWILNTEYLILNTEYWILNAEYWILNTEYCILVVDDRASKHRIHPKVNFATERAKLIKQCKAKNFFNITYKFALDNLVSMNAQNHWCMYVLCVHRNPGKYVVSLKIEWRLLKEP